MSRNDLSRFAYAPSGPDRPRSSFNRDFDHLTTFNIGDCVPFFWEEVYPGDTFKIKTSKVVRLQTPITPFMGNIVLDTYYFFVPYRLVWQHFEELMGANKTSAWVPEVSYSAPIITAPAETGWTKGTIADYLGIPTGIPGLEVSAMPFRAYALIMNEWFRNENVSPPLAIPTDDVTVAGVNTGTFVTDVAKGGKPYVAAKFKDYFTSCLPGPLKANENVAINIPLEGAFPVFGSGYSLGLKSDSSTQVAGKTFGLGGTSSSGVFAATGYYGADLSDTSAPAQGSAYGGHPYGVLEKSDFASEDDYVKTGLQGEFRDSSVSFSVNALRTAFQIQKLLERDARSGSRYTEILRAHFGTKSPDARLQRPEYLGGNRIPINVTQVIQNSESANTPQGTTAAYSHTVDSHADVIKSFVEHGMVFGIMVARYYHSYQNSLNRMWSRRTRFDWFWPVLSNIGEQPVLVKELYCTGTSADDEVFGYQEAWADMRWRPSITSGEMRSNYATSLDFWHLADDYDSQPYLSDSWIREDKSNVDRVLAVSSSVSDQLLADIFVQNSCTREIPLYSIPGLIDHH